MEIIKWLVTSSANPQYYSLAFKGAALAVIPWALQLFSLTCGLHILCVAADGSFLTSVIETVANIIYFGLSLLSAIFFLSGLARKFWLQSWSAYGQTTKINDAP